MDVTTSSDDARTTILLVVGTGGFTHAAPVLELGRILAKRGHIIQFATHQGQQKWVEGNPAYSFISQVYTMGDPMSAQKEEAHYLHIQQTDPRVSYMEYFRPKFTVDAFWTSDYACLQRIVQESLPDMILADFFVDAARDIGLQYCIPVAMVWPQMPYGMVGASYIPGLPGFQVDALTSETASIWTRIRAALRPIRAARATLSYLRFVRDMRRGSGVHYALKKLGKPDYLVLVNSFWGLETPKDLPPLVAAVGPILSDEYPDLDDLTMSFFAVHTRVVYVSFGTHVQVPPDYLERILGALVRHLDEGTIDGIIWAANKAQLGLFPRSQILGESKVIVDDILSDRDPHWLFTPFAPQRAILDRPQTVLFVTHGGGSSVNEATFHGTPMLSLGFFFDQPLNGLRIQEAGVGLFLDKAAFTQIEVYEKTRALLKDENGMTAKNVQRMRHIAQISSRKKEFAADLIQEMLYDHKYNLAVQTGSGRRRQRPMHLETADARMSAWRAQNWDLTCMGLLVIGGVVAMATAGIKCLRAYMALRAAGGWTHGQPG
ncbi:UDP-glucosyl transferase family protein [Thelonectria olida]|uniref:UDP-glucosyl transferase family protein n=1 Tax=Thelonectria olida TaxID=1576542 RepID=A0A9P9AL66_9HYPO|nr:UDP-glucosyl transferase family protein [Thelonectria olida]